MRVNSGPARAAIQHWRDLGCSIIEIADGARLPKSTVLHLCYRHPAMVDEHTERALLSARPRSARIAATRKMQALACMGHPVAAIAEFGSSRSSLEKIRCRPCRYLAPGVGEVIDRAWAALWHTPGGSHSAMAAAKRNGWAPPLAWDDIDDPAERPKGVGMARASGPVRFAELRDMGLTRREIAEAMGVLPASLERYERGAA